MRQAFLFPLIHSKVRLRSQRWGFRLYSYMRELKKGANRYATKSAIDVPFSAYPYRAVSQLLCGACFFTASLLRVQEHCVLVQQHTKKKEAVRVLNMVHDSIVAVCLHACYHVRIGCIPDVSVSVLRTQHSPNSVNTWFQKAALATLNHECQFGAHHKIRTGSNFFCQMRTI
jgi:hypothetical protein